MKLKFTLFITRVINKLFWQNQKGRASYNELFEYLHNCALEGKNFGTIGRVDDGGEEYVIKLIEQTTSQEMTIFDVGANIGQYQSLLLKTLKNKKHVIYSFEPSAHTFKILQSNKVNSNCHNINSGLGEREEELNLLSTDHGSPLSSLYTKMKGDYYNVEQKKTETVNITTLDLFVKLHQIDEIYFLKIDVEGHELPVLKGAQNQLKENKIKFIQFEFGPTSMDSRTFLRDFKILLGDQYSIFRIVRDGIVKVDYSEKDEVFYPVNYLAVHTSKLNDIHIHN